MRFFLRFIATILLLCWWATGFGQSATYPHVTVRIHSFQNYSSSQRIYVQQAAQKLEELINSTEFRDSLLATHYWGGASPQKVYDAIMRAHEKKAPRLDSLTDYVVDMWLKRDSVKLDCNGTSIGGDGAKGGRTTTCPNRLRCWTANGCVALMAGHLMHEYLHQLGYIHLGPYSQQMVPYAVGYAVVKLLTDPRHSFKLKKCAEWPEATGPCSDKQH